MIILESFIFVVFFYLLTSSFYYYANFAILSVEDKENIYDMIESKKLFLFSFFIILSDIRALSLAIVVFVNNLLINGYSLF